MHPELALEDDVKELLREHEELARLLLEDAEAGQCEMGTRLFEELESLRDLNERQELEKAKRALEESGRQKDLLLKEVDHRVKNSLQIVSSLLHMQAKTAGAAASQFHNAAARVAAIAAVHQQLHKYDDVGTVVLDRYLIDLCQGIAAASSSPDLAMVACRGCRSAHHLHRRGGAARAHRERTGHQRHSAFETGRRRRKRARIAEDPHG